MSLLNQLFNRGLIGQKGIRLLFFVSFCCKTCLTLAISRIKLLQNKRDGQLKLMRKEIAQFLLAGQEPIARIRVEHVIREQNIWQTYEILEMFCEFVLSRIPIIDSQRECPSELQEAVARIIFAAARCSDLPDLLQNGPKQMTAPSWAAYEHDSHKPPPTMDHSTLSISSSRESKGRQSPTPISSPRVTTNTKKPSIEDSKSSPNTGTNETRLQSSDALEKARAAVAAAERASAAARLAANLVKLKSSSVNLKEAKS